MSTSSTEPTGNQFLIEKLCELVKGKEELSPKDQEALIPIENVSAQVRGKIAQALLVLLKGWNVIETTLVSNTHISIGEWKDFNHGTEVYLFEGFSNEFSDQGLKAALDLKLRALPYQTLAQMGISDCKLFVGSKGGIAAELTTLGKDSAKTTRWALTPKEFPNPLKRWVIPSSSPHQVNGSSVWVTAEEHAALKKGIRG